MARILTFSRCDKPSGFSRWLFSDSAETDVGGNSVLSPCPFHKRQCPDCTGEETEVRAIEAPEVDVRHIQRTGQCLTVRKCANGERALLVVADVACFAIVVRHFHLCVGGPLECD
jgi:hypothetical protein